jgi:hypothetical protein
MAALTLNLRIPTARPLTPAEHDENFTIIDDVLTGDVANATLNDFKRVVALLLKPAALIQTYTGSVASIPAGWKLCNGSAYSTALGSGNVPDLRDKFIVGAKQDDSGTAKSNITGSLAQTGGSTTHGHGNDFAVGGTTLTAAQSGLPAHRHPIRRDAPGGGTAEVYGGNSLSPATADVDTEDSVAQNASTPHDHPLTGSVSNGTAIPPFYALAFITYVGV